MLTDVLPKLSIVKNLFNRPLPSQQCHPKYGPQIVSGPNRNSKAPWDPNSDPMQCNDAQASTALLPSAQTETH